MLRTLANINLVIAFIATTGPIAHVLELLPKLALDGPLWLGIQQHLYRGWGAVFGPVEILALLSSLLLMMQFRDHPARLRVYLIASLCYALMLICFFVFNNPVNQALNGWTAATMPADWMRYRTQWEIGHALAALLSVIAFIVLIRARLRDHFPPNES
jgi:hypothetical protein